MAKSSFLSVLLAVLLVAGCASAPRPPDEPPENTSFYLARFERTWDTIIATLNEKSIPIDSLNKDAGLITTGFVNYSVGQKAHHEVETIAVKPDDPRLAIWSQAGYSLIIKVTPVSDLSTRVKVTANIEAYNRNISQQWHACVSRGILESGLLEEIRKRL